MEHLNIALLQTDIMWKNPQENFIKIEKWLDQNREDVDLVILPEMFNTGFVTQPESVAETMDGQTVNWLRKQALQHRKTFMGSLIISEKGQYYNRLIWVNPQGEIQTYDKRHLFTYGGEHKQFTGGDKPLVVELFGWKIKPLICYDLRFPVWAKNTHVNEQYEYDVLIYIANWPSARAHAFRQLLIGRAIENQAYVVGVNRVGVDGNGLYYQGNSTVIDFKGYHLMEFDPDEEGFKVLSLAKKPLQKFRQEFPIGADWDQFNIIQ
jgi:predicted amidohydrolase